jgi:DNA-binding CsgD family transcriptional regulator
MDPSLVLYFSQSLREIACLSARYPRLQHLREAAIDHLMSLVQAKMGVWSTGTLTDRLIPLVWIPRGIPTRMLGRVADLCSSRDYCSIVQSSGSSFTASNHSDQSAVTWVHRQSADPDHSRWRSNTLYRQHFEKLGVDDWVAVVHCEKAQSTWSSLVFFREYNRGPFEPRDLDLIQLVASSIAWLHAPLPITGCERLASLSDREIAVLTLLLSGCPRKQIATQLDLTGHVVNDCVKSIFKHFGTNSAIELASQFLRSLPNQVHPDYEPSGAVRVGTHGPT